MGSVSVGIIHTYSETDSLGEKKAFSLKEELLLLALVVGVLGLVVLGVVIFRSIT